MSKVGHCMGSRSVQSSSTTVPALTWSSTSLGAWIYRVGQSRGTQRDVHERAAGASEEAVVSEEDRSLMMQLTQSQILDRGWAGSRQYGPEDGTRHGDYRDDDPLNVITQERRDSSTSEVTANAANLLDEALHGEAGHNEAFCDEALRDEAFPEEAHRNEAHSPMKHGLVKHNPAEHSTDFVKNSDLGGRKYSIGSETDQQGKLARSFSDKSVKLQGGEFQPGTEGIGYACKKGLKPEAPNQDSFFIMKVDDQYSLYGVFDGHGSKGHDVSNFVKDNLPKILFSQDGLDTDPKSVLLKTFAKTQYLIEKATALKQIDATRSGTTCSVVLHSHKDNVLHIAHVGDSRVVLGKMDKKGKIKAIDLTVDHKPDMPEEA
ncbi:unnamed protein product [Prorocentrum cordatum]|uniref:PPM-type phosphatase domain-containing protein n=1 Tax=Prorocentrum cordatum TaxID=2364126 RepID=A0ABN9SXE5_9DINO|nr:unnamed protein product [Polarella glacialis]